ncbi:Ribonuclease HI [Candidatus Syntrophocurvum alkaliphilum]|uniref:Ribonuclease H n=1 Tax=Candidatus Syntrophocurvum alkaliphilum TaxID=2293317 RepID=A0A6I6DMC4_9FIRM|nr:ribonuclease HI [Candidatus Syntrophocurvum alkaliphilum]QGU00870.1 Ribonuclease HI [Candidatus Syntrophocurvum alkaliphilum]
MKEVTIYTDGACSGNPGPGGWGAVLIYGEKIKEIYGYEDNTTNQRMELKAVIEALKMLKVTGWKVEVYSDSAYIVNAFNQKWIENWERNGWKNSKKDPVANQDLWKELVELSSRNTVILKKVKGHSGDKWNDRSDELARLGIKEGNQ